MKTETLRASQFIEFNFYNVDELSGTRMLTDDVQVQIEKEKFTVVWSRSPHVNVQRT